MLQNISSLSNTERKVLEVLSDGGNHTIEEFRVAVSDNSEDLANLIKVHVSNIRRKIACKGLDIVRVRLQYKAHYRLVRNYEPD